MTTSLKEQIIELYSQGNSYNKIASLLGCSKGTISFHIKPEQKIKNRNRTRNRRKKSIFFIERRIASFHQRIVKDKKSIKNAITSKSDLLNVKARDFFKRGNKMTYNRPTFKIKDVFDKFGEYTNCYLTGEPINLNEPSTYHFDHIIPSSKGGQPTLENLGICTGEANLAKHNKTPEELFALCKKILTYQGYQVIDPPK